MYDQIREGFMLLFVLYVLAGDTYEVNPKVWTD